jgi:Holliday junction resolvasome RuvABC DNA-binding subunit
MGKTSGESVRRERNYDQVLESFGANSHSAAECVQYLLSLGYTRGQARNAVYRYRAKQQVARRSEGTEHTTSNVFRD